MDETTARIVAQANQALIEAAREHKRLEFAHRRTAKRLMQTADDLRTQLAEYGIRLSIDGTDKES